MPDLVRNSPSTAVLAPALAAAAVLSGGVLGRFATEALPAHYLVRPLLAAALLGAAIGTLSLLLGSNATFAAVAAPVLVIAPNLDAVLLVTGAAVALALMRLADVDTDGVERAVLAAVAVFFGLGLARAIPLLDLNPYRADASTTDGTRHPVYLILLDGYPRADTLQHLGIDISPFLKELESRGFEYYADAHSLHGWTHHTLTAGLTGQVNTDGFGTIDERRALRKTWSLPSGFVVIEPPVGSVTIPHARSIGPGGINDFEIGLLGDWATRWLPVGDLVMGGLRARLEESLTVLSQTDEPRVFAHLLAPHPPFLYSADGSPLNAPDCWPERCNILDPDAGRQGVSLRDWTGGMAGTLDYLNRRLLESIDSILERRPGSTIVLFSDHGGRYSEAEPEEWHRTFLAARTPQQPGQFLIAPRPDHVLGTYARVD